jgi:uncharacterized protein
MSAMLKEKFFRKLPVFHALILLGILAIINPAWANDINIELLTASEEGRHELVTRLLKQGASANARRPGDHCTPLTLAVGKGHRDISKSLLQHGADVNAANINGWTALMAASSNGDLFLAELLLAKGAVVDARHLYGWTALKLAKKKGHRSMEKLLKKHGARR